MGDLDLLALRLDGTRRNGAEAGSKLEARLSEQLARIEREGAALRRERVAVRREARLVILAWALLLVTTVGLGAGWPTLMGLADWVWAR
jgi:hypothetical protein